MFTHIIHSLNPVLSLHFSCCHPWRIISLCQTLAKMSLETWHPPIVLVCVVVVGVPQAAQLSSQLNCCIACLIRRCFPSSTCFPNASTSHRSTSGTVTNYRFPTVGVLNNQIIEPAQTSIIDVSIIRTVSDKYISLTVAVQLHPIALMRRIQENSLLLANLKCSALPWAWAQEFREFVLGK